MKRGMALATTLAFMPAVNLAQQNPSPLPATVAPRADTTQTAAVHVSLDEAIRLALQRNHALQAQRTMTPGSGARDGRVSGRRFGESTCLNS